MSERSNYTFGRLDRSDLLDDPIAFLTLWLRDAFSFGVPEHTAMCLSTVSSEGRPSSRFVLLREVDPRGLTFYTNYGSRKATEIDLNPNVSATIWWARMERQIRIEGRAERVSREESEAYFRSRPRESQIASSVSPQSQVIKDRDELDAEIARLTAGYEGHEVPYPDYWGGYRIIPEVFEFWQGRPARVHDRFRYTRSGDGWLIERLAP